MSGSVVARVRRATVLSLAGVLAASALSSSVVAAPATVASTLTRVTSCAGLNFHPIDSRTVYSWRHRMISRTDRGGDGWFLCDANLPDGAVVTRVRFTLYDNSDLINIAYCALVRGSLGTGTGDAQAMAVIDQTGMAATPGSVRRSDTTIVHATVDQAAYGYWLQCQIIYADTLVATDENGIIGATVTYRISSADG